MQRNILGILKCLEVITSYTSRIYTYAGNILNTYNYLELRGDK